MFQIALLSFSALSKSGLNLIKKVVLKLKIQKNNFDKKYAPKFLSFNEKNWKDLDEFFT